MARTYPPIRIACNKIAMQYEGDVKDILDEMHDNSIEDRSQEGGMVQMTCRTSKIASHRKQCTL